MLNDITALQPAHMQMDEINHKGIIIEALRIAFDDDARLVCYMRV